MHTDTTHPPRRTFLDLLGMASGALLLVAMWLPWYSTSSTDPYSRLAGASGGGSASAWQTFSALDWVLVVVSLIPFALSWTLVRNTTIGWNRGEITMLLGIIGCFLIVCNGIILGKPAGAVGISLGYGYFTAMLATLGIAVAGYMRQLTGARIANARKPPGIL